MSEAILKQLKEKFISAYGQPPSTVSRAPGRLEILGNHTDYNEGMVLSCAVSQSIYFAIRPNNLQKCRIFSMGFGENTQEIPIDEISKKITGDWKNYIKGVICEFRKRNCDVKGFDAGIASDLPLSAGMSSSAAIEVSACMALEKAFGFNFSPVERAKIGQGSENNFVGARTGLLDQFSSIFGKENSLILCDFRKNEVIGNVPLPLGHSIVVVNTMIKHDLVDSEYNDRRESCENVMKEIGKTNPELTTLRDLSSEMLDSFKSRLAIFDYRKGRHITEENERVAKAVEFLDKGDIAAFGKLLFESHKSSRLNFENSCPELDYLVELAQSIPGCLGARLSGGGFGGISIHIVAENSVPDYVRRIKTAYKLKFKTDPQTIECKAGSGAQLL
ncbi:MAG TPA: galactokinase [Victivallales bacterium]|nr:galactokinase [Victivallales bacterium]